MPPVKQFPEIHIPDQVLHLFRRVYGLTLHVEGAKCGPSDGIPITILLSVKKSSCGAELSRMGQNYRREKTTRVGSRAFP
jgi:hypothetical protein